MSLNLRYSFDKEKEKKHLQACDTGSIYGRTSDVGRKKYVFDEKDPERQTPSKRYSSLYKKQASIFSKLRSRSE